MDKKAIAEIRKLMTPGHCVIDRIRGIYVDDNREILMEMKETFLAMQEENAEKYCDIFKKTLSGKLGRNLFNLEFPLEEEKEGGRQEFLYRLQQSELKDEDLVSEFFEKVVETYEAPGKYLVLLVHGMYDIPARTSDGNDLEDGSDYVYSFLLCSFCPVTERRDGLCYDSDSGMFIDKRGEWMVQKPDQGFLFPAYNDRMPDLHSALYYARKEEERHSELTDGLLGASLPMKQSDQASLFSSLVEETLGRDCDYDNVVSVQEAVSQMIEEHKDDPEPLQLEKADLRRVLSENGASQEVMETFDETFDEAVGEGGTLMAESLVPSGNLVVKSPSVRISIKSDMKDMLQTRVLDGREYLVIPIQDEIEVNGIRILPKKQGREDAAGEEEVPF
jgi:hypothetical protein